MAHESEGVSTRYLLGAFFAVVLLCAVFFSLGYFLGYREGRPPDAPLTEHVAGPTEASPPVNRAAGAPASDQPSDQASDQASDRASDLAAEKPTAPASPVRDQSPSEQQAAAPLANSADGSAAGAQQTPPDSAAPSASADTEAEAGALTPSTVPSGLLVQVGAVTSRQEAIKMGQALRSSGYPALVLTPRQVRAGDSFFRIVAGPYKSRASASAAIRKLATEGYKPFIRQ